MVGCGGCLVVCALSWFVVLTLVGGLFTLCLRLFVLFVCFRFTLCLGVLHLFGL